MREDFVKRILFGNKCIFSIPGLFLLDCRNLCKGSLEIGQMALDNVDKAQGTVA